MWQRLWNYLGPISIIGLALTAYGLMAAAIFILMKPATSPHSWWLGVMAMSAGMIFACLGPILWDHRLLYSGNRHLWSMAAWYASTLLVLIGAAEAVIGVVSGVIPQVADLIVFNLAGKEPRGVILDGVAIMMAGVFVEAIGIRIWQYKPATELVVPSYLLIGIFIGLAVAFFGSLSVAVGMAKEMTMAMPDLPLKLESIAPSAVRPLVFGGTAASIAGALLAAIVATRVQRGSTPRN